MAVSATHQARMQLYITIRPAVTATVRGTLGDRVCDALRAELGLGAECTGGGTMFSATFEGQFSDIDLEVDWVEQPEDKATVVEVCRHVLAGFEMTAEFAGER